MPTKPSKDSKTTKSYDVTDIRVLAKILTQFDLTEMEVEYQGQRIRLRKDKVGIPAVGSAITHMPQYPLAMTPPPAAAAQTATGTPAVKPADDGTTLITSPFVGTFYRAPSPESPPFVEAGQTVQKGKVLCIVEAMKLMNEIETETNCKIVDILVKNAEPVEFGQPLFKVLPTA